MQEAHAKSLIFSQWHDVLVVVAHALTQNQIAFETLDGRSGKKLQQALQRFRHDAGVRVLLLPLKSGARGLNLVCCLPPESLSASSSERERVCVCVCVRARERESDWRRSVGSFQIQATHVFLIEPILDPTIEQQAVSRVHRIGQQQYGPQHNCDWRHCAMF
jgi:E3 ubiquitin-protein ligase SHPRH